MITLEVQKKENTPRVLREKGLVPGIVYGKNSQPLEVVISQKGLKKAYENPSYFNKVMRLKFEKSEEDVIPKAIQKHPVTGNIIHADFMRIKKDSKIRVSVPIRFINDDKCAALKRGGVLNIVVHALEVKCSPYDTPESLIFDLSNVKMHDTMTLSQLNLPKEVTAVHPERDNTLASIVMPTNDDSAKQTETSEEVKG